ncbi:hypothetical protein [Compostibacter hankyongensis]|uniref:Uncharacterized protein n=1 Tax=Compostibacter hankyongensis TaxID=1007089 RepID=A0ABP8FDE8_9BACT
MRKTIRYTCFLLLLTAVACREEKSTERPYDPTGNMDYQPVKKGASWQYVSAQSSDTLSMQATGEQTTRDGISYFAFTMSTADSSWTGYMGKSGVDYYLLNSFFPPDFISGPLLYLKDGSPADSSWTQRLSYKGIGGTAQFVILDREISLQVGSQTFPQVVHVQMNLAPDYLPPGFPAETTLTADYYIARDVGIVYMVIRAGGVKVEETRLVDYEIP